MVPKQQLQLNDNFKCHLEMALNKFFPVSHREDGAFMLSVHTGEQKTLLQQLLVYSYLYDLALK